MSRAGAALTEIAGGSGSAKAPDEAYAWVVRGPGDAPALNIDGSLGENGQPVATPFIEFVKTAIGHRVRAKRMPDGIWAVTHDITSPSTDDTKVDAINSMLEGVADAVETAQKSVAEILADAVDAAEMTEDIRQIEQSFQQSLTVILQNAAMSGTAAQQAASDARAAQTAANAAQNSLKSVVQGATTVEKAVSVMQAAMASVIDYDPNTTAETFAGDGSTAGFALQSEATDILSVTVGGEAAEYASAPVGGVTVVALAEAPASGAEVVVTYEHATMTEWFWHDADGAHVLGDKSGYRNNIGSGGMDIVETATEKSVAAFSAGGSRIGKDDESRLMMDYHSLQLIDQGGKQYFHVSDLRDTSGYATIVESFVTDGSSAYFEVNFNPRSSATTTFSLDGESAGPVHDVYQKYVVPTASAIEAGHVVEVSYQTNDVNAKAFTFGTRRGNRPVGALSSAMGRGATASGNYSYAEGDYTVASGKSSHAEGFRTIASGDYSHAEGAGYSGSDTVASGEASHAEGAHSVASGAGSHAEGSSCTASGDFSHAEGYGTTASGEEAHSEGAATEASGDYSHAQGLGTIAAAESQFAGGKYNVADPNGIYSFILGNGTSDSNRSNGFAVRRADGLVDVNGETSYPMFVTHGISGYTPAVTPCFMLDSSDGKLYHHDGVSATRINPTPLTGVKGNAEAGYRTGNVNLTPANIGAAAASGPNVVVGRDPYAPTGTNRLGAITFTASPNSAAHPSHALQLIWDDDDLWVWCDTCGKTLWKAFTTAHPIPVSKGGTGGTSVSTGRQGLGIQTGAVTVTPAANGQVLVEVTFPKAYSAAPIVMTSLATSVATQQRDWRLAHTATATKLNLYVYNAGSNTTARSVQWVAIGTPA